jgi:hypothetical protein
MASILKKDHLVREKKQNMLIRIPRAHNLAMCFGLDSDFTRGCMSIIIPYSDSVGNSFMMRYIKQ